MTAAALVTMPQPPARAAAAPAVPQIAPAVANQLSPSQVNTWLDCGARWFYKYAMKEPDFRTPALATGEQLHAITASSIRIWQRREWSDEAAHQGEQLLAQMLTADLQQLELPADQIAAHVRTARDMFAVWVRDVLIPLAAAAEHVELAMAGTIAGVPVTGAADVVTRAGMIVDLKTAGKKPSGISQAHRLQLATYCMLADQLAPDQAPHTKGRLITITKTATPQAIQQTVEISAADRSYALWAYSTAQQHMRSGEGVIPRRSSLLCSRANCAYADQCEEDFGGCVRD